MDEARLKSDLALEMGLMKAVVSTPPERLRKSRQLASVLRVLRSRLLPSTPPYRDVLWRRDDVDDSGSDRMPEHAYSLLLCTGSWARSGDPLRAKNAGFNNEERVPQS